MKEGKTLGKISAQEFFEQMNERTLSPDEEFVVELETEKAAAGGVNICLQYMRILGLYTAAFWSDGFLGLTQSFNLEL